MSTPLSDEQLAEIRADHFKVVDTFGIGWRIPLDPEVDTFEEDDEPYDRMVVTADSGDPFKPGGRYVVVFETAQQEWLAEWLRHAPERENELLAEVERLNTLVAGLTEAAGYYDELIEGLTRLIPDEYDSEGAVEAIILRWAQDQIDGWKKIRDAHQPCPFGPGEGCEICEVLDGGETP